MKRIAISLSILFASAAVAAASLTASWIAPTTNTDGSTITASLTYNLYTGSAPGTEVKTASALTAVDDVLQVTAGMPICAQVTAVANGIESARSAEVCATAAFPIPNAPTGLTVK